jgi:membrane protein implicated in regulation of membrane protease activity
MLAISGFITAFGAFGLTSTLLLRAGTLVSLLFAATGGLLVGAAAQMFFVRVLSTTISSNLNLSTIKGTAAQVITPIPAIGLGQIALVLGGQRVTLGARASAGQTIGRGTHVIVDSLRDGVAFVSLVPDD